MNPRQLRNQFTDRRLYMDEGIGAGNLGQLDLTGQGCISLSRGNAQRTAANAGGELSKAPG